MRNQPRNPYVNGTMLQLKVVLKFDNLSVDVGSLVRVVGSTHERRERRRARERIGDVGGTFIIPTHYDGTRTLAWFALDEVEPCEDQGAAQAMWELKYEPHET